MDNHRPCAYVRVVTRQQASLRITRGGRQHTSDSEKHITPMWMLPQRITHHSREYTSQDTKPQRGLCFRRSATETSKSAEPRGRPCFQPFVHQSGIPFGSKSRRRHSIFVNIRNVDLRSLYLCVRRLGPAPARAHTACPTACCMCLVHQTLRWRLLLT